MKFNPPLPLLSILYLSVTIIWFQVYLEGHLSYSSFNPGVLFLLSHPSTKNWPSASPQKVSFSHIVPSGSNFAFLLKVSWVLNLEMLLSPSAKVIGGKGS